MMPDADRSLCKQGPQLINTMTVDVEDYFQVSAFSGVIARSAWESCPQRIVPNIERIMSLFDGAGVKGTFFVLGWIAERHPDLVRAIADAGHEIASHGYEHVRVTQQTPEQFSIDVQRTKALLEDITGQGVMGYRAASFSIDASTPWAPAILHKQGFRYSSSIYPIQHDHYGMRDAPRFAYEDEGDGLLEIPISTAALRGRRIPCGGGGYFRLYPYWFSRWALRRINARDRRPAVFYFHPWELDPGQPRTPGVNLKTQFRHYINLKHMEGRIERLLRDFRWGRMDQIFLRQRESTAGRRPSLCPRPQAIPTA